jgi:hypothetical protein
MYRVNDTSIVDRLSTRRYSVGRAFFVPAFVAFSRGNYGASLDKPKNLGMCRNWVNPFARSPGAGANPPKLSVSSVPELNQIKKHLT